MEFVESNGAGSQPAPTCARVEEEEAEIVSSGLRTVPADDFLGHVLSRYFDKRDALVDQVRRLRALRTRDEDARKRVLSAKLVTTPNAGRILALRALIIKETEEMRPLLEQLLERIACAEIARQQLHVFEAAERQIRVERKDRDQRQLTPLTYEFVDCLYHHHDVDGSALSSLEEEDYAAIAEIVKKRHAAVVPELYGSSNPAP